MEELELIQELMEELQEKMQYDESDFSERLGREKPEAEIEVMKIEGEGEPMGGMSEDDELMERIKRLRKG